MTSQRARFDTTHWNVVIAAGRQASPESRTAMAELSAKYWYPLYVFVRRRTPDVHEAQDLTQAFFVRLLEKNFVAEADPARGRFRTFLQAALKHFMANEWQKARTQKRGGGRALLSLDLIKGEQRYEQLPQDHLTPERQFDRQWVLALLSQVLGQMRSEAERSGNLPQFQQLEPTITAGESGTSYTEVASRLGMTPGAVKVAVHRLRKRYRELLRAEIAQTLADPETVDDEIRHLFETFA